MQKMFYPNPGDTIVCENGEEFTCVSEEDYPWIDFHQGKAIYAVLNKNNREHMNWIDNTGIAEDLSGVWNIKEVIPCKPDRRVHADLIIAWANGAKIEREDFPDDWVETENPLWDAKKNYRIKPERKPDVTQYLKVSRNEATIWSDNQEDFHNLKIIFDGETDEPIFVELIGD